MQEGIVRPLLIENQEMIELIAYTIGFDLSKVEVVDNREGEAISARIAVYKVKRGEADIMMKVFLPTSNFLKAGLDKESGLRNTRMGCDLLRMRYEGSGRFQSTHPHGV